MNYLALWLFCHALYLGFAMMNTVRTRFDEALHTSALWLTRTGVWGFALLVLLEDYQHRSAAQRCGLTLFFAVTSLHLIPWGRARYYIAVFVALVVIGILFF